MDITPLQVGPLITNCYLVSLHDCCIVIDPGADADFISTTILEKKLIPKAILLTHGHFDHCLGVLELKLNFNLPVYLHPKDLFLYQSADKSSLHWTGDKSLKSPPPDKNLSDNQSLIFDDLHIKVIHTPGHTPGSVCFLTDTSLFTGDTLFATGVGRTDLPYSSKTALTSSLKKIHQLPPKTSIYPGHEEYSIPLEYTLE